MKEIFCKIENKGEVDINAFRLLGASSKEGDDTKIGYFGSGIKYALASALREKIPIKCFSGKKEIKISVKEEEMRGEKFEVICIDGIPTSMTTRMGKDWQTWFIIREFYCNAIDEGEETLGIDDDPKGEAGKTRIFIGMTDEVKSVFDNLDHYFSFKRTPIHEHQGAKVFDRIGEKMTVYRKGIRVFNESESLYDYDFPSLDIDESRNASDFNSNWKIVSLWRNKPSEEMIAQLINSPECREYSLDWSFGSGIIGQVWLDYLKDHVIIPREHSGYFVDDMSNYHIILPHCLCLELHKKFGDKLKIRGMKRDNEETTRIPTGKKESELIEHALGFLERAGIKNIREYPISLAALENHILGKAEEKNILLNPSLFFLGRKKIIEVVLEEYIHIQDRVFDRTREMQNTLITMVVSSMEDKLQEYL